MKKLISVIAILFFFNILHGFSDNLTQDEIIKTNWITKINDLALGDIANKVVKTGTLQCNLTPKEKKAAKLYYPESFYDYYNAILTFNAKKDLSKYTQDFLVYKMQAKNALEKLLVLQLAFVQECENCRQVRDKSNAAYFTVQNMREFLAQEGGKFSTSYVLAGEAFLCQGLANKNPYDLLMAYANFMLAGLHTRAFNSLIESITMQKSDIAFETLRFLVTFDHVFTTSRIGAYYLGVLRAEAKYSNFNILAALPHFRNLRALEYSTESNYGLQILLIQDMQDNKILLPFDKLTTRQTLQEFRSKAQSYMQMIHKNNQKILARAQIKDLQEYYKILRLKQRLKQIAQYPYATSYVIPYKIQ